MEEEIFYCSGPADSKHELPSCAFCKGHHFKSKSERTFCDFCAFAFCKNCISKKRQFPEHIKNNKSKNPGSLKDVDDIAVGNICIECDRKFFIRAVYEKHWEKVNRRADMDAKLTDIASELKFHIDKVQLFKEQKKNLFELKKQLLETKLNS